ncbi:MAG: N-acetylneuraminate synthase [Lachnospiraceae bacterium]|nr:N-acetylneuraminate synthase [Lachnospiraceae bacterium]
MSKVLIIAEAGVNHNGNIEIAKKLAQVAKECGADVVKFQTAKLDSLVSKCAPMADYQKQNIGQEKSQKDMLEKLLLSYDEFVELAKFCEEIDIKFLSTPFDIDSIRFLDSMQDIWKIPSGEITNYPYLKEIANTGKKVYLSTGMSNIQEVESAFELLKASGTKDITLLHCTTEYPAPMEEVNLNVLTTLKERFDCAVGYSDHTKGIEVVVAAVVLGATVVEKHFTLDKNMEGPDHKASLEPHELKYMVECIRNIEIAMGDGEKKPTKSELKNKTVARKSIVAKSNILKGEVLSEDNLTTKRPGNGISPMRWNEIIGTVANRDYEEDELIEI